MARSQLQQRHLLFLSYIWVAIPLLCIWLWSPGIENSLGLEATARFRLLAGVTVAYFIVRTIIAAVGSPNLKWAFFFPPIDIAINSSLILASGRPPISNMAALYLLAIVEAAETQSIWWIVVVSGWIAVCEAVATWQHHMPNLFGRVYPYFFLFGSGVVAGLMAISVARDREKLAIAQDRERIASEMHDGVQGHLVTAASQLELIGHLAESDPKAVAELAREARELTRLAADELRYLVHRLKSPSINAGFGPSLSQFAYLITQRSEIDLNLDIRQDVVLAPEVEHALFRIAQEAINNAIRHSRAETISVSLKQNGRELELVVSDNGDGFDAEPLAARLEDPLHTGMSGMSRRAADLGGKLAISSSPKDGTCVTVRVPST